MFSGKAFIAQEALDRGLVDQIGYPEKAYDYAASLAGITNPSVVRFTPNATLLQLLTARSNIQQGRDGDFVGNGEHRRVQRGCAGGGEFICIADRCCCGEGIELRRRRWFALFAIGVLMGAGVVCAATPDEVQNAIDKARAISVRHAKEGFMGIHQEDEEDCFAGPGPGWDDGHGGVRPAVGGRESGES